MRTKKAWKKSLDRCVNRLKKLVELEAPPVVIFTECRMILEAALHLQRDARGLDVAWINEVLRRTARPVVEIRKT